MFDIILNKGKIHNRLQPRGKNRQLNMLRSPEKSDPGNFLILIFSEKILQNSLLEITRNSR